MSSALYTGPTTEDLDQIPEVLTGRPQWVLWRGVDKVDEKTGEIKLNKVPYTTRTYKKSGQNLYRKASSTNPETWTTFDAAVTALPIALAAWEQEAGDDYRGGGIGYVFSSDDPFCGVDLDKCRDPETGALEPLAADIVAQLDSYSEASPTETGVHTLVLGTLPKADRKKGRVEIYNEGRYFTMSGKHLPGTPLTIEPRQEALTAVHVTHVARQSAASKPAPRPLRALGLDDMEIVVKAKAAKNGAKFAALWAGDTSCHDSNESNADEALCCALAFWTRDASQIDRIFRDSGLMRTKWERQDYRDRTIAKALDTVTTQYDPEAWLDAQIAAKHGRNGQHATPKDPEAVPLAPSWLQRLNTTKNGEAKETFNNLALSLEHLGPWSTESWYDVVRDRAMVATSPLDDAQVWAAARAIEQATRMPVRNLKLVANALRSRCHQTQRDKLQEWLADLPSWDEEPRLTEWLCDHASVPKTAYSMAVARLLCVSMVARALQPGIQCRSVVILEGLQDIGKSRLFETLAGAEWYRKVSGTLEGKEAHMLMKGAWLVELEEMDVLLRTEESRVKAFVTMTNDEYVPKYANDPVKLARRTILVGTINPEGDGSYLRDQTGATRYYPVRVGTIALDDIAACRDQLFAEALVWFKAHPHDWWQMPEDARAELDEAREARRKEGVFEGPRLREWLAKVEAKTTEVLPPFHTEDALRYCFHISADRWTASIKDQVGKAISKCGWMNKPTRQSGELKRLWHRVTPEGKV